MKYSFCLLALLGYLFTIQKISASPDDNSYQEYRNRTLLVRLLTIEEESARYKKQDKIHHNTTSEKFIEEYVNNYNSFIRKVLDSVWTFNHKIIYQTNAVIQQTTTGNEGSYLILNHEYAIDFEPFLKSKNNDLLKPDACLEPGLVIIDFTDTKNTRKNAFYFPFIEGPINYWSITYAVVNLQKSVYTSLLSNKELSFSDYVYDSKLKYCSSWSNYSIFLPRNFVHKSDYDEVSKNLPKNIILIDQSSLIDRLNSTDSSAFIIQQYSANLPSGQVEKTSAMSGVFIYMLVRKSDNQLLGNITFEKKFCYFKGCEFTCVPLQEQDIHDWASLIKKCEK